MSKALNKHRKKFTLRKWGLAIVVAGLVLISLALSVMIWLSVGKNTDTRNTVGVKQDKQLVSAKAIENLYDFSQVVMQDDDHARAIRDYRGLSNRLIKRVTHWRVRTASVKEVSANAYVKALEKPGNVVLIYPDHVAGEIVQKRLNQVMGLPSAAKIDRIQLPLKGRGQLRLFDDVNRKIYQSEVIKGHALASLISDKEATTPVHYQWFAKSKRVQTVYENPLKMHKKNYLINTLSMDTVLASAFPGRDILPTIRENDDQTIYTGQNARQLIVDKKTDAIQYINFDHDVKQKRLDFQQNKAYETLDTLQQMNENLYYFDETDRGQQLGYRLYVNGLPVFNQAGSIGALSQVKSTGHRQVVTYARRSVTVPLPDAREGVVTLPDSNKAYQVLTKAGYQKDAIQNMTPGYVWVDSNDGQYASLQPTWFIKYQDQWATLADLKKQGHHKEDAK